MPGMLLRAVAVALPTLIPVIAPPAAAEEPPARLTADMSPAEAAARLMAGPMRASADVTVEDEWDNPDLACTPVGQRGVFYDEEEEVVRRPRLRVEVNFPFGSAELTAASAEVLDVLAAALADPMIEADRFLLVGHTDAVGSDGANRELSRRRAGAVLDHLAGRGVAPERLRTLGCGEAALLDPKDPRSPINRRVEVVNAGP